MKKFDQNLTKAVSDQIRVSVTQALLKVLGQDNGIRITDATVSVDKLEPIGHHLTLKLSIDIYPFTNVVQEEVPE